MTEHSQCWAKRDGAWVHFAVTRCGALTQYWLDGSFSHAEIEAARERLDPGGHK